MSGDDPLELPEPIRSLTTVEWVAKDTDATNAGDGVPPIRGVRRTIRFGADSSVSGSAGCNSYRSTFEWIGNDGLRFGALSSTRMACEPEVMAAEAEFVAALGIVRGFRIEDESKLVLSGDGVELVFVRSASTDRAEQVVGEWEIIDYRTPVSVRTPVPGTAPTIRIGADGMFSIDTGCNRINTSLTLRNDVADGEGVEFTAPMQTLKACAEPEGVMDQEAHLAQALMGATRLTVEDDRLGLLDDERRPMIRSRRLQ